MEKKELIATMVEKTELKENDCESALNAFVDVVSSQLQTMSSKSAMKSVSVEDDKN